MPGMKEQLSREDASIRNIDQTNALVDYVRRAGFRALNEYQQDKVLSLTTRQGLIIATVARMARRQGGGITLSQLARELHMSTSAASHLITTLEELNLLTREADEEDRRSVRITLSAAGQKYANLARQGMLRAIHNLTSRLTEEERAMLIQTLNKLYSIAYPAEL